MERACDTKFQALTALVGEEVSARNAAWQQLDEDWKIQWNDLKEATADVSTQLHTRVATLEDIVPLEITARQKVCEKLRKRADGMAKSMTHVLESLRSEMTSLTTDQTLRMNGLAATMVEVQAKVDDSSAKALSTVQKVQAELQSAISHAMECTSKEHALR